MPDRITYGMYPHSIYLRVSNEDHKRFEKLCERKTKSPLGWVDRPGRARTIFSAGLDAIEKREREQG
jgi:hypothetical protein